MFKHLIALVLVALAIVFVSPAVAQQPPGTSVGTLTCKMAPSIGLIFGSRQRMACRFAPSGPQPPEAYVGVMGTIGLDIGSHGRWGHGMGRTCTHCRSETRRACWHLRGREWRDRRWRRRWCKPLVRRNGAVDRLTTAFCRGVGWNQSVSWSFKSHAFLGPMKKLQKPPRHPSRLAASSTICSVRSQSSEDVR